MDQNLYANMEGLRRAGHIFQRSHLVYILALHMCMAGLVYIYSPKTKLVRTYVCIYVLPLTYVTGPAKINHMSSNYT